MLSVYGALVCSSYCRMLPDEALYSLSVNVLTSIAAVLLLEYAKEMYCSLIVIHIYAYSSSIEPSDLCNLSPSDWPARGWFPHFRFKKGFESCEFLVFESLYMSGGYV